MRLKKRLSALLCAALAAVIALSGAVTAFAAIYTRVIGTSYYGTSYQVVQIVNRERRAVGLPALGVDEELTNAAVRRAAEISILFDHVRPNGQMCFTVSNKMYGENIAYGYGYGAGSAEQVMEQWMASPGHKENILREEFKSIGVGCFEIDGVYYWAQAFGYAGASGSPRTSGSMEVGYDVELAIAPLTPESFNVYARGGNGAHLYLEWGDTGAEQYRVYIYSGTPGTSSYRETLKGTTTENRFVFTDLVPGWEYNVMVVAQNQYGTAAGKTTVCAAPEAVTGVSASAGGGRLDISWQRRAGHGYVVQWSTDESFSEISGSAVINSADTTSFTAVGINDADIYYARVRSFRNFNGEKVYSSFSTAARAQLKPQAPGAPRGYNVYARGDNGTDLYLEWNEVNGVDSYRVYIYSGTPGTSSYRETLKGKTTENKFVFTDLEPGWEYNVMVVAANEYGSASSKTAICAAPARIESFYADAKSSDRIEAGWSTAACHGYLIQWSRDESFSRVDGSAVINGTNTTRCTINVSGAADYYVRVRAWRNYNGDKVYSEFTAPVKAG